MVGWREVLFTCVQHETGAPEPVRRLEHHARGHVGGLELLESQALLRHGVAHVATRRVQRIAADFASGKRVGKGRACAGAVVIGMDPTLGLGQRAEQRVLIGVAEAAEATLDDIGSRCRVEVRVIDVKARTRRGVRVACCKCREHVLQCRSRGIRVRCNVLGCVRASFGVGKKRGEENGLVFCEAVQATPRLEDCARIGEVRKSDQVDTWSQGGESTLGTLLHAVSRPHARLWPPCKHDGSKWHLATHGAKQRRVEPRRHRGLV
mmetsp:Transcript_36380/g.95915  ORF Transcript_36380/g.95915 Transcript_36380/m.95915 type:complete len:264 (+) Transcript_36380:824-1615(+)